MRTSGSMRQACACTTWARPISPPSRVTNELSDMFCDLNGATRSPSCRKIRHSAAVNTLLPALELTPWSMMAGVFRLEPVLKLTAEEAEGRKGHELVCWSSASLCVLGGMSPW